MPRSLSATNVYCSLVFLITIFAKKASLISLLVLGDFSLRLVARWQWQTGSEFSTGHDELKGTLFFTNTEGFKCISAKRGPFLHDFDGGPPAMESATARWCILYLRFLVLNFFAFFAGFSSQLSSAAIWQHDGFY